MTETVYFSLVGDSAETDLLKQDVLALMHERFGTERVADFGDPKENWGKLAVGKRPKKSFSPRARLPLRTGVLFDHIERIVIPHVKDGATLGLFRRLGPDTVMGANGHSFDPQTLRLWGAIVEHGLLAYGLGKPLCYYYAEADDLVGQFLHLYCTELPGQHYERIPHDIPRRDKAACIVGLMEQKLRRARMAA